MQIIGKDGRAALLREVAKSLQMPVDEIVPSREKSGVNDKQEFALEQQTQQQQQPEQGMLTQPDGSPKGGMDGNIVSNRDTGGGG
jgi:hypothetical protein